VWAPAHPAFLKVPKSLDQRLKGIEITSLDSDMQSRAKALREKLRV
jgi:hypothetical protein